MDKKLSSCCVLYLQDDTRETLDSYAKQGREVFEKMLNQDADYESVEDVNKKIMASLVIGKKNQMASQNAENSTKVAENSVKPKSSAKGIT